MTPRDTKAPKPPSHLSSSARRWWAGVAADWDGLEAHHLKLLTLAAGAWDRAEEARQILAKEGVTYTDRFGAPRRHPAGAVEAEARVAFARLVKQLNLDDSGEPGFPRNQWRRPKPKG